MTQLFLETHMKLFNEITALQNEEKSLQEKLKALQSEAKSQKNNLYLEIRKNISNYEREIKRIEQTYLPGARSRKLLSSDYYPLPRSCKEADLLELSTKIDEPNGDEAAILLQKKCLDLICHYKTRIEASNRIYEESAIDYDKNATNGEEAIKINRRLEEIRTEYVKLSGGTDIRKFASKLQEYTKAFKINKQTEHHSINVPSSNPTFFSFGCIKCLYPIRKEYESNLKEAFQECYDESDKTILLPLCYSGEKDKFGQYNTFNISISFDEMNASCIYKISQGIIFNILRSYKPLPRRILYIDTSTYNSEHLDCFSRFVGEDNLITFPKTINEAKKSLQLLEETIMSEPEDNRQKRYLFAHISDTRNSEVLEIIKRISHNCKKNNITTILLKHQEENTNTVISNVASSINIYSENGSFFTNLYGSVKKCFFFESSGSIDSESERELLKAYEPKKSDNKYESHFSLEDIEYLKKDSVRTRCKDITVPYGLDRTKNKNSEEINSLTFGKTDFATFIMGASGSGKSTLIHSIITGLIKNYHPDEVELWLADFKLSEFAPYTQHPTPPHIKYIVMDHSLEIIYDFIDLMIKELRRRQVRLAEVDERDRDDTKVEEDLPTIFVIIDEFSALSEAIMENDSYKRKLDELLSRGRSNGFRFIFASQAFTDGASALSSFAKKQIQSRIAMKNTVDEIRETLSIPSSQMTDTDRLMIDELQKYHALHKREKSGGGYSMTKSLVMYFEGSGLDSWANRYAMFKRIYYSMKKVDSVDPSNPKNYKYKNPVFITNDSLTVFKEKEFLDRANSLRTNQDLSLFYDDKIVSFGMPRVLKNDSCIYLSNSARENIFLLTNKDELPCSMSVIFSAISSFAAQNVNIQIWGHERNKLFRHYKDSHFSKINCYKHKDEICWAMDKIISNIRNRTFGNDLIVLLGMDRTYEEFSDDLESNPFDDISYSSSNYAPVDIDSIEATTPEEIEKANMLEEDAKALSALLDEFYTKGWEEGKTDEQLDKEWDEFFENYMKERYHTETTQENDEETKTDGSESTAGNQLIQGEEKNESEKNSSSNESKVINSEPATENQLNAQQKNVKKRNYAKDFSTLVKIGSKYGYHFLVVVDDYRQLSDMGLGIGLFNHRLAFRTDSSDTSMSIFNSSRASKLNDHVCFYNGFGQSNDKYLITPYLHKGIYWENWYVNDENNAVKKYIF